MTRLLAEYKRASPWSGPLTDRALPDVVSQYDADPDVFGISIVADPNWGGSLMDVERARELTTKPILAKFGRHMPTAVRQEAVALGANWYLTHDWVAAAGDPAHAWLELCSPQSPSPELPLVIVCNNRDIRTGELDPNAALAVAAKVRQKGTMLCAASGYKGIHDVPDIFDFGLIGTYFLKKKEAT